MEVLACSSARHVGESDCPDQGSETALKHDGKSNSVQDTEQSRADLKVDGVTNNAEESHEVKVERDQLMIEDFPASEGGCSEEICSDFDVEGQNPPYSVDLEDINSDKRESSESGVPNINQEGSSGSEFKTLEHEPMAVWVKWRGAWQSGIRCARADWPLSTLRAKPTHGRKEYVVIFFPHTRNYSWADVLLIRPINDYPYPLTYKTHKAGMKVVKDLTLAHRFIMQKLAVRMLNILDQLGREALVETARDVSVLKDFAMEASRCKDYSDLGRMLLKLHNMVLQRYISPDWLHRSMQSWKQRCQDANTAECIEMLKEELSDSIMWDEVNSPSNEKALVDLGSDWKNWKHEVMKWFSVSHPISISLGPDEATNDSSQTAGFPMTRKRPKLDVRRADNHTPGSHQTVLVETNSTFGNGFTVLNTGPLESKTRNDGGVENTDLVGSPGFVTNKLSGVVIEDGEVNKAKNGEVTPSLASQKPIESGNHNRQCIAFIESKGRQCVRYANEGDVYCCVHLATRFISSSAKSETKPHVDSPMCGGTTVLGTKCKHRALVGTSFCKKHRPQDGQNTTSPVNKLKRKNAENLMHTESRGPAKVLFPREIEMPPPADMMLNMGKTSVEECSMLEKPQQSLSGNEVSHCLGSVSQDGEEPCPEIPKRHFLYCEKHIPCWLRRARNGKSRIVSKEVFMELLKNCNLREQKINLHRACDLFYRLFKSALSLRNPVPKEVQFQWAIAEASKDSKIGEFLVKLVVHEKERLKRLWGFGDGSTSQVPPVVEELVPIQMQKSDDSDQENVIKCKICSEKFLNDEALGNHWMESHKKEAQWLFRGYVCAICLDSFTNKKLLEAHVQERHHVQFVEQCMLLQCIPCGSHCGNPDQLWLHVLSVHPSNLRFSNSTQQEDMSSCLKVVPNKSGTEGNAKSENQSVNRRFICKFCGLKFDLLPDLGRHHQAAHMSKTSNGPRLTKKGIKFYTHKLKSGRPSRPRFKKGGLTSASYNIRNKSVQHLKKRMLASTSVNPSGPMVQSAAVPEGASLGRLEDSQFLAVAKLLLPNIKRTKLRPSNSEILSLARSACCKFGLQASLELKYESLPERVHLKAAKLCCEQNISIEWLREGFICPNGCIAKVRSPVLSPAEPLFNNLLKAKSSVPLSTATSEWTMDESHCVIDSRHFSMDLSEKNVILCDDISFGLESLPIACVVDENLLNAEGPDDQMSEDSFPWENFTYVTKSVMDQSINLEPESLQLKCACVNSTCSPETCDHVYLFENDYEDAKDIYGKSMNGRFPYDERGRIILEEGYLVYECNQRCCCSRNCQNRVLQNGVQVKLEIFKTEKKGWAVRAREAILRGTFVCEYIGEIIDENEANERLNRYGKDGCKYFFEVDARVNDISRLIEGQAPYVMDSTTHGNVARFINHSCSPNLVNHQVLIESMDSQLAHIGLYASRDIAVGEELTYDFRFKLVMPKGEGCPCLCGASNCRGKLY